MDEPRGNSRTEWSAWLVREWTTRLAQTLESMAEKRPGVEWQPATGSELELQTEALAARHGTVLWWEQGFSAAPEAHFWVGAPESLWSAVGKGILSAAGIDEADAAETRNTWIELLSQSLESLANAMGAHLQREVVCQQRAERDGPPGVEDFFTVELELDGTKLPPLFAAVSDTMAGAMSAVPETAATGLPVHTAGALPAVAEAAPYNQMLDLLLDVELPVSISFGRTHLPLKDTLKLTTGSIVELNRTVSEPVEVIVNNCVIARGEVVVIEGNYGVRIREIMSRQDRLRNLR